MRGIVFGGKENGDRIVVSIGIPLFKKYLNGNDYITLLKNGTLEFTKEVKNGDDVLTSNKVFPNGQKNFECYILSVSKKKLNNSNYLLLDLEGKKWFGFKNKIELVKKVVFDYLFKKLKDEGLEINVDEKFEKYLESKLQYLKTITYASICSLVYYILKYYYKYNIKKGWFARKLDITYFAVHSFLKQIIDKEIEKSLKELEELHEYFLIQDRLKEERKKKETKEP